MTKKKVGLIVEIFAIALVLIGCIFCTIAEFAAPEKEFVVWIKENIWDIEKSIDSFVEHIPLIIQCFVYVVIVLAVTRVLRYIFKTRMDKNNRMKTIFTLFDGFIKYACASIVIIMVLKACGVNTAALVASVGVLTLVVGLGAQSLIADIIAGMFIIFENEYNVGEIISIDGFRGTVSEIGIRSTKLVDGAGNIKIINNSNIGDIINLSRELSVAVVDVDFPYDVPIEKIENIINDNLEKLKNKVSGIIGGPYYKGICAYKDSNVTLRLIAQCEEANRFQIERDLLREYRALLVENNIDIAYPQVVINYAEKSAAKVTQKDKIKAENFIEEQNILSKNIDGQERSTN